MSFDLADRVAALERANGALRLAVFMLAEITHETSPEAFEAALRKNRLVEQSARFGRLDLGRAEISEGLRDALALLESARPKSSGEAR
ncbi:MAG: hypothetical protein WDM91_11100 [Rhizomicrobium sp.]